MECVRARVVEPVVVGTRVGWIVSGIDGGAGASICGRMASGRLVGMSSSLSLSKGMTCGA